MQIEQELNNRNKKPNIPFSVRKGFGVLKNLTPRLKKKFLHILSIDFFRMKRVRQVSYNAMVLQNGFSVKLDIFTYTMQHTGHLFSRG